MSSTRKNFSSPHVHPQSLDSGSTPEAFAEREVELGSGTLTCTDHGTMQACRKVYDLAQKHSLTPILGAEMYFRDDNCPILEAAGIPKNADGKYKDYIKYHHITVHYLDYEAYLAGVRLLSNADLRAEQHGSERKPLFDWKGLEELGSYNVTMTSGCLLGMASRHLLAHQNMDIAKKYYEKTRSLVKPGNFYVEMFPHDCSKNWSEGVFATLEDETGRQYQMQWYDRKLLKTDKGEIRARDLAKDFHRGEHTQLIAVKNYHLWLDLPPGKLITVEYREEFIKNECVPWAPDGDVQAGVNKAMQILARRYGDPLIASDDAHLASKEAKLVQDVRLAQSGNWRFSEAYTRFTNEEAFGHFQKTLGTTEKEFNVWLDNNEQWAERFKGFKFESKPELPVKFYEPFYANYSWSTKPNVKPEDHSLMYTMELIKKHGRMDWKNKVYVDRLQMELKVLHNNGTIDLLPYFFIDEDVCSFYESKGLLTGAARGSASGVLLSYLIGITHVDPIKYDLPFERFITLDRIKSGRLPDIDQDLGNRDILTDSETGWLKKRFSDHYAQISTDTTLKLKAAAQDVARFLLGYLPPEIVQLTKKFQMPPQGVTDFDFVMGYENDEGFVEGSLATDPALKEYVRTYPSHWDIVTKALGLARQKSKHACGFVIANRPIHEFIPLMSVGGDRVTSYTAQSVEAVGGIKMDFLRVSSLNDIQDCVQGVQRRHAQDIDLSAYQVIEHDELTVGWSGTPREKRFSAVLNGRRVPSHRLLPVDGKLHDIWDLPKDPGTFADISCGRTETVFQFSTPGAVQWLGHFGRQKEDGSYPIDSIESMAAFTALDRPGPLDMFVTNPDNPEKKHNLLVEYARRARGDKPSPDILPVFDQLIPETHSVMCFQEQLQKVYQKLTGCSGSEAEEFRSDVAKKKKSKLDKAYLPFVEKASVTIGKENAEAAWAFFITWAKYGFSKNHAVPYAATAYACAFLKHHYPLEWWCAVLKNASKNEINEKFWKYVSTIVDLPDISLSSTDFEIKGERIRAPLSLLQGIGDTAHAQLMKYAPYTDLEDFCRKIQQNGEDTKYPVKKTLSETGRAKWIKCEPSETDTYKKGHNGLNRGVVYSLIMVGAMDSILPKDPTLTVSDHLMAFEQALAIAQAPPGRKKPPKPKAIDPKLVNLGAISRYQLCKTILPVYSGNLLQLLIDTRCPGVSAYDETAIYKWSPPESHGPRSLRFATCREVEFLETHPLDDNEKVTVAIAAFVDEARRFNYGDERKEACEVILDVNGARFKFVKWGGKTGKVPKKFEESLKGSIVVAVITKFKSDRPFSIDDLEVVAPPFDTDKVNDKETEE